jgi:hypothetical protein
VHDHVAVDQRRRLVDGKGFENSKAPSYDVRIPLFQRDWRTEGHVRYAPLWDASQKRVSQVGGSESGLGRPD